jgi:hypothetical protein
MGAEETTLFLELDAVGEDGREDSGENERRKAPIYLLLD